MFKFCSLKSGSSGNCYYIQSENVKILIDAGMNGKTTESLLKSVGFEAFGLDAILITHEHRDHISGAGVLSRRYDIPIFANSPTWNAMARQMGKISEKNRIQFVTNKEFAIGDITVLPYIKSHDAAEPVMFCLKHGGHKISVMTDLGYISKGVARSVMDSDILVLESNHDVDMLVNGGYPYYLKKRILSNIGHLSNETAGRFLVKMSKMRSCGKVFLGHLSHNNNTPELAYSTVDTLLKENGIEADIKMALRDSVSEVIDL